ncbi:amine sulfotransferase-like [Pleurodeles waltl]|uniref:amine sulfotransferase-like n=1 Tax=Pleurodeles waltl TaxID=8319 RepID=UPI0037094081
MAEISDKPSIDKLFLHRGIHFLKGVITPEEIDAIEHFPIRDSDVFLVTYPKSGTVWMQQILSLIYHDGHHNKTENLETVDRAPWLEYNFKKVNFEQRPSPRLFTTHLPYYLVPKGLKTKKAKVIYVTRNPKDSLASYFHFNNMLRKFSENPTIMMEEHFDDYLNGKVIAGSWFDHVKGWYTHKDEFNILFLQYEDMVKDLRGAVLKICSFVGKGMDDQTVDTIVERATFKNMKKDVTANYEKLVQKETPKTLTFLRKGTIGDWKNVMTVAQNEKFDKVFQEKMKDVPIKFIWDINEN